MNRKQHEDDALFQIIKCLDQNIDVAFIRNKGSKTIDIRLSDYTSEPSRHFARQIDATTITKIQMGPNKMIASQIEYARFQLKLNKPTEEMKPVDVVQKYIDQLGRCDFYEEAFPRPPGSIVVMAQGHISEEFKKEFELSFRGPVSVQYLAWKS